MELKEGERLTSTPPREIDGTVWRCVRLRALQYEWRTEDGRCTMVQRSGRAAYMVKIDGAWLLQDGRLGQVGDGEIRTFRLMDHAMRAAMAQLTGAVL